MALDPGTSLGPYEILSLLGAGGMGEVYRARDPRLGRDVAIKVSAQKFNERFEREAKVVASLNHPNICTLYDIGPNYIVMELVEGEEPKGPMPLDEALEICRQIAAALEAAHEKGIVHRDLKPANIKLTPTGTVKVLDFGLAKINPLTPASGSNEESPTISMHATQAGMILGTAGYMAPEQAKGKPADKRADIWAFGVILHELLTGHRLFLGETVTDTLAAVVLTQPKLENVPFQVRRMLQRCLEKDPQKRLRDIGDAMALLEEAPPPSSVPVIATPAPARLEKLAWVVAGLSLLAAGALAFVHFRETPPVAETVRFKAALPENVNFTATGISAISPDGRKLAFSATGSDGVPRVWIRSLDSLVAQPLPGAETVPLLAVLGWSPDSRFVVFQGDGKFKKIDTSGGPALPLFDAPTEVTGGSWNRDGVILFEMDNRIIRVSASGGSPTLVVPAPRIGEGVAFPTFLPDGRHFLYLHNGSAKAEVSGIYVGALDVKPEQQSAQRLMEGGSQPLYASSSDSKSGYILILRQGTLMAQPFDPARLQLQGEPIPVAEQVASLNSLGHYSVSDSGALAYRTGTTRGIDMQLSWFDREGKATLTAAEASRSGAVKVSPDGKRAALVRTDPQNNADIWIVDLQTGASNRLTFDPALDSNPLWSPDGSQIVWESMRGGSWGIYRKASDGSGNDELLYKSPGTGAFALTDWSRDGRFILFHASTPPAKTDIFALPIGPGTSADRQPIPVIQTPAGELGGYVSPDGRWIAYMSDESGREEVYVQAFNPSFNGGSKSGSAPVSGKWMVSKGSVGMARWRSDGKELVFISTGGAIMSVDVTADSVFHASPPKPLFQFSSNALALGGTTPGARMDATRDLQRFLVSVPALNNSRQEITVVLNWQAALKH
jgi:Tol biopolymer transport system component/predicted Ser/Thr protein kinase